MIVRIQSEFVVKITELLSVLRQHPSFAPNGPTALLPHLQDSDSPGVYHAVDALLGEDSDMRAAVIRGFITGHGDFEGFPCTPQSLFLHVRLPTFVR